MAKRKLSKEEFEKLSDGLKVEYEEKNGYYFLKLEDDDEAVNAIRQAKDNEVSSHKETKKKMKELEDQLAVLTDTKHRENGDIKALDASWQAKFTARENELTSELGKYKGNLVKSTKDNLLNGLAAKLVKPDAQRIFKKSIEDRITVEFDGETAIHRILDNAGKVSAMTLEDLEKEIVANKEYSSIIVTSKASGGQGLTTSNGNRSGGPSKILDPTKDDLANASANSLAEHITTRLATKGN